MDQGTFCTGRNTMAMLAIAKSLPDALKVVVTSHSEPTEDGLLQLHIGLDGASHTVPFRHGMLMDQLKDKVLKITGIPVEEQMYIFAEDARLVDVNAPVPLDEPLRCIRSTLPPAASKPTSMEETSETTSAEECKDSSEWESWPRGSPDESWADLTEEADRLMLWENVARFLNKPEQNETSKACKAIQQQPHPEHATPSPRNEPSLEQGSSLARDFTERWRQWDEGQHQHQFYIGIPEDELEEFLVVQEIKKACPKIYKANVMIRLRGRGSGFLEGRQRKESSDPLMICISGRSGYSFDDYWESFYKIASLLEDEIYAGYNQSTIAGKRCQESEVHLEDDWVRGGVRVHGEARPLYSAIAEETVSAGANTNEWAREFTDAWRAWDENERQHQFTIEVPDAYRDEFQVVRRIKNACRSLFSDSVMLRCRGRGSGFIEGRHKAESSDPLMVCLSGRDRYSLDVYWSAFYKLAVFLEDDLYADYNASIAKCSTSKRKRTELHLNYSATHGGVRKGGRVNEHAKAGNA